MGVGRGERLLVFDVFVFNLLVGFLIRFFVFWDLGCTGIFLFLSGRVVGEIMVLVVCDDKFY